MSSSESEHLIDRRLARAKKTDGSESNKKSEKERNDSDSSEEAAEGVDANNTKEEIDPVASEEDGSDAGVDIDEDESENHEYPDGQENAHRKTSDQLHEKRIGTTVAEVETVEEDLSLPKGFVPLADMNRALLDHSTIAALKSKRGNELWLVKLPPNFDAKSLDGQTVRFKAPSRSGGQVASLARDTESPIAVTLAPAAEYSRVVSVLPSKSANRLQLGVPIDRQLTLVNAIETPPAPPATPAQVAVKQAADLRLRFRPIGSTKKTGAVTADPLQLLKQKKKDKTTGTPLKTDAKRKSAAETPVAVEDAKNKKPRKDEKLATPAATSSSPKDKKKREEPKATTPTAALPKKDTKTPEKKKDEKKKEEPKKGIAEKKETKEKQEKKEKSDKKEKQEKKEKSDKKAKRKSEDGTATTTKKLKT